jgi:hypothetical protein
MCEMAQKLMNASLFSFQGLKLSTRDIIVILKDTLNTTLGPLPIPDPHAIRVPSNTLERHSINSRVANGVRNIVTSSSMAKLMGLLTSNSTFTYQKGAKNTSLMDLLLNKDVVDNHSFHKVSHSFPKVVRKLPSPLELPLLIIPNQQSGWEDIHLKWYFLI